MRRLLRGAGAAAGALLVIVACARQPAPEDPGPTVRVVPQEAVIVGGWLSDADAALEAVLPAAGPDPAAGPSGGPYRLRGIDDAGRTLFELAFGTESLAVVPGQPVRRFMFVAPTASAGAAGLAAVELDAGDGLVVTRRATVAAEDLVKALTGGETVRLAPLPGDRVRVAWDVGPVVVLRLRDPVTGSVLALDRDGEVIVAAPHGTLEVAISDGIRSVAGVVELP